MTSKTFLIVAGICGLAASSPAQTGPAPVAWYKFDEGASATTAVNSVAGGTDGVVSVANAGSGGAITTGVAGISGNAYQFTKGSTAASGGYVDMGPANFFSSITASGELTLTAWVKTNVTANNRNTIIFAGDDTKTQTYLDLGYSGTGSGAISPGGAGSSYDRVRPNNIGSGTGVTGTWTSSATPVNNDGWNHLVMTMNVATSVVSIYLNGALQSSMTLTSPNNVFPTFNNFEIGRLGRSSPTDYFTGYLDDVQVYSSSLTGTQINWLYNNPGQALTAVPEPAEVSLAIAAGLGLLVVLRRNRRQTAKASA